MEGVDLLDKAMKSGLQVKAEGDHIVIRGPRSAEAVAMEILANKVVVMALLAESPQIGFVPWVLQEWRRTAIPQWQSVLQEATAEGDMRRIEYARWILDEVLQDEEEADA